MALRIVTDGAVDLPTEWYKIRHSAHSDQCAFWRRKDLHPDEELDGTGFTNW
ncbi:MAG: hypothetical protein IPP55_02085 [Anaerolineales bacterium]|nr:hypothetical protein [Anaerolineales bacterium]